VVPFTHQGVAEQVRLRPVLFQLRRGARGDHLLHVRRHIRGITAHTFETTLAVLQIAHDNSADVTHKRLQKILGARPAVRAVNVALGSRVATGSTGSAMYASVREVVGESLYFVGALATAWQPSRLQRRSQLGPR
jgi:hypothetical protein